MLVCFSEQLEDVDSSNVKGWESFCKRKLGGNGDNPVPVPLHL